MKTFHKLSFLSGVVQGISRSYLHKAYGPMRAVSHKVPTSAQGEYPILGDESLMKVKAHGSTDTPVQQHLKWGVDRDLADRICCFNRHYAEPSGYFEYTRKTSFLTDINHDEELTFYDSVSGKPLYIAPRGRTFDQFLQESRNHGWPSFRDNEVVWENVRCLKDGETVSVDGTHLGHNLPDMHGNRYCINLVSIAGSPKKS
mmetsp:Transcript_27717/g.46850  ORF Transcript_27717/g.46850 Transcript_27717/m.46850 type:complete len:201 (+) Transcript_27717:27-629(+)